MMPIRIGLLGAARITDNAIIRPAYATPEVEIAAIAARDPQRAQRFAQRRHIATVHTTYADLVADPTLDAIYNPLPNHAHGCWTLAALRSGKHVLCEKPITANATEAAQIVQAAQETGRIVMEAFHYRYHPMFLRALEIVASGELGPLQRLEAHFCTPFLRPGDIRYRYNLAGGATMDLGCYAIHMLRSLAGVEPIVIHAEARCMSPQVDRRMDADLIFHESPHARPGFSVRAHLVCAFFSSTPLRMILTAQGEHGELRLLNPILPHFSIPTVGSLLSKWLTTDGLRMTSQVADGPQLHRLRVRTGSTWRTERFPGESTYAYQLQAFIRAIEDNQPPVTDAQDGLANMRVIDAIYARADLALRQPAPPHAAEHHAWHDGPHNALRLRSSRP